MCTPLITSANPYHKRYMRIISADPANQNLTAIAISVPTTVHNMPSLQTELTQINQLFPQASATIECLDKIHQRLSAEPQTTLFYHQHLSPKLRAITEDVDEKLMVCLNHFSSHRMDNEDCAFLHLETIKMQHKLLLLTKAIHTKIHTTVHPVTHPIVQGFTQRVQGVSEEIKFIQEVKTIMDRLNGFLINYQAVDVAIAKIMQSDLDLIAVSEALDVQQVELDKLKQSINLLKMHYQPSTLQMGFTSHAQLDALFNRLDTQHASVQQQLSGRYLEILLLQSVIDIDVNDVDPMPSVGSSESDQSFTDFLLGLAQQSEESQESQESLSRDNINQHWLVQLDLETP